MSLKPIIVLSQLILCSTYYDAGFTHFVLLLRHRTFCIHICSYPWCSWMEQYENIPEFITPLKFLYRYVIAGNIFFLPDFFQNNDEKEKKERQLSRLQQQIQSKNFSPTTSKVDQRKSINVVSGLTNQQLTEHYSKCIQLSTENVNVVLLLLFWPMVICQIMRNNVELKKRVSDWCLHWKGFFCNKCILPKTK